MRVSAKVDYALRACAELAGAGEGPVKGDRLAQERGKGVLVGRPRPWRGGKEAVEIGSVVPHREEPGAMEIGGRSRVGAPAGAIAGQYFASALSASSMALVTNLALVTKVYFPRVLLPIGAVLVPMVDFIVGLPVLIVLMAMYGTWPKGVALVTAPAFLALAVITALGIGFFLSSVNVRYRDVPYIIPVFLQVLPLVSGVMYAVNEIPTKWQWILAFNPMTAVIAGWRWAVLGAPEPVWTHTAIGVGVGIALFLIGLTVFRSSEPRFADSI